MSSGPSSPYSPLVFDIHIKLQSSFLYVVLYRISAHDDDIQNSFFKLFIDLFLAVLGRLCSASFSPVVAAVGERLITMGSLVADHRLWARGLQERQRTSSAVVGELSCPLAWGTLVSRPGTKTESPARRILNQRTTRSVLKPVLLK